MRILIVGNSLSEKISDSFKKFHLYHQFYRPKLFITRPRRKWAFNHTNRVWRNSFANWISISSLFRSNWSRRKKKTVPSFPSETSEIFGRESFLLWKISVASFGQLKKFHNIIFLSALLVLLRDRRFYENVGNFWVLMMSREWKKKAKKKGRSEAWRNNYNYIVMQTAQKQVSLQNLFFIITSFRSGFVI